MWKRRPAGLRSGIASEAGFDDKDPWLCATSMNCLPVIEMEMRSACRRKWTFRLRLLFAGAGAFACGVVLAMRMGAAEKGRVMLGVLSFLSLFFCLAAGGAVTADCVSSEKRDGTLGLLYLTPLKGLDIILGKLVSHGLELFYAACALAPIFFLPLLIGGVTWAEVSRILLTLALALLLAACIGILVSVLGTESRKTFLTMFASILLLAAVPLLYQAAREMFSGRWTPTLGPAHLSPVFTLLSAFDWYYQRPGHAHLFWESALALFLMSLLAVVVAGLAIKRVSLSGESVSRARASRSSAASWHSDPVVEANPYEWKLLRGSGAGSRLGLLNYCLLLLFVAAFLVSVNTSHWQAGFTCAFFTALGIHIFNKLRVTLEATRQVHFDRQSGALELLLVTTLSDQSLFQGYHRAIKALCLKPLMLLLGVNVVLQCGVMFFPRQLHTDGGAGMAFTTTFVGGMLLAGADFRALRWLALWNGIRAPSHLKAALVTFGTAMVIPWIVMGIGFAIFISSRTGDRGFGVMMIAWVAFSLVYDWLLVRLVAARLAQGLRSVASGSLA